MQAIGRKIVTYGLPFVFVLGGILFLFLGFRAINTRATFLKTTATVTKVYTEYGPDNSKSYNIYVTYNVDGVEYTELLEDAGSGEAQEGKALSVLVNPADHTDVRNAAVLGIVIRFIFGAGMLLAGGVSVIRMIASLGAKKKQA